MKPAFLLAIAVVTLSSLPFVSHRNDALAQESAAAGAQVNQSAAAHSGSVQANGSASTNTEMRPVNAELVGKLDAKSAKTGDTVIAKTQEKIRTADGTEIPKGSRLVGHVTDVQAHGSGHSDSHMTIAFDRAELKSGQSIAIRSVIQSIAPPASAAAMDTDDAFAAPVGGGSMATSGSMGSAVHTSGHTGSGLVGGAVNTAGGVTSTVAPTTTGVVHATDSVASNATAGAMGSIHGTAATTESLGTHATAIPGVMLTGDATGSASGTLSAANRNVHLDSGSQLVLGVAAATTR